MKNTKATPREIRVTDFICDKSKEVPIHQFMRISNAIISRIAKRKYKLTRIN